jgi:hypothetical protein
VFDVTVDQVLEIDLNNLTPQTLSHIDQQVDQLVKQFENRDNRSISDTYRDPLTIPTSQKEEGLRKVFGKKTFSNLLNFGKNPIGFGTGLVTRLIPFIGTALLVTGVVADFVKKVDEFQKEFVNNVDGRIDLFRSKETQARIQAGLEQLIITSASGSVEPRDAYNTFTIFNENQSKIETEFRIRDTAGVD